MTNVQWKENGKTRYENLLSENSVEDFVKNLRDKNCTDIVVTYDIEKQVAQHIKEYNSPKRAIE